MELLSSSQRAYLRSLANRLDAIFQIGKDGIGDTFVNQIDEALNKRELIKLTLLETSPLSVKEAADILCEKTGAQSVQMIGRKLVLYRESRDEEYRKIELPAKKKK